MEKNQLEGSMLRAKQYILYGSEVTNKKKRKEKLKLNLELGNVFSEREKENFWI